MKIKKILLILLVCINCAKERDVEPAAAGDLADKRFSKNIFTGDASENQNRNSSLGLTSSDKKWLFKSTIVNTSDNASVAFTGFQSQMMLGSFEFEKNNLTFNNALSLYGDALQANKKMIASWPITHSEYRLRESGGMVTNVEEEDNYIPWNEKNFFNIDFGNGKFLIDAYSFSYPKKCFIFPGTPRINSNETIVSPEHIAFTINVDIQFNFDECLDFPNVREYFNNEDYMTLTVRFSFKPIEEVASVDYPIYKYDGEFDPLNSKYGFFKTTVEKPDPQNMYKNEFLMNRWNPNRDSLNPHIIYFAPDFPNEYRWVYEDPEQGIIARTNALYERNGVKTRFAIQNAPENVRFGDVGVSFIKYVPELSLHAPLGYGPSDANPLTGEIVAANTVMWGGLLENYMKRIEQEIKLDEGKKGEAEGSRYFNSDLYAKMRETLNKEEVYTKAELNQGTYQKNWTETAEKLRPKTSAGEAFSFLLPEFTFGYYGYLYSYHDGQHLDSASDFNSLQLPVLFDYERFSEAENLMASWSRKPMQNVILEANKGIQQYFAGELMDYNNSSKSTVYGFDSALIDAQSALIQGKPRKEILDTIFYRVAIHEFGHNLGLRHNFYGSVDAKHHRSPINGRKQTTSSVMDYRDLTDELHDIHDWEAYDEAALAYAYSSGKLDLAEERGTTYLYCTDEHRLVNAMCAAFDRGTTPSEVALSIIKRYETRYWIRNYRFDRPYWYTGSYIQSVFQDMWDLKKFLKLYNHTYSLTDITSKLKDSKWKHLIDENLLESNIVEPINEDMKRANLLVASFYHALIQQKDADRPWLDVYDDFTGALELKGILWDKVYALFFLIGDAAFPYSINKDMSPATYTTLFNDGSIGSQLQEIFEKTVVEKVAAQQGFESLARAFYTLNASSYVNRMNDASLIERIRFSCYRPESLKNMLGIDYEMEASPGSDEEIILDAKIFPNQIHLASQPDIYFKNTKERIGVVYIDGVYYVALESKNSYAFSMIDAIEHYPAAKGYKKSEIVEIYNMYSQATRGSISECQ